MFSPLTPSERGEDSYGGSHMCRGVFPYLSSRQFLNQSLPLANVADQVRDFEVVGCVAAASDQRNNMVERQTHPVSVAQFHIYGFTAQIACLIVSLDNGPAVNTLYRANTHLARTTASLFFIVLVGVLLAPSLVIDSPSFALAQLWRKKRSARKPALARTAFLIGTVRWFEHFSALLAGAWFPFASTHANATAKTPSSVIRLELFSTSFTRKQVLSRLVIASARAEFIRTARWAVRKRYAAIRAHVEWGIVGEHLRRFLPVCHAGGGSSRRPALSIPENYNPFSPMFAGRT